MVLKVELKKKPMDSDKKTQKYLQEPVLFFGDERLVVEDVDALALQPRLARRPRRRLGAAGDAGRRHRRRARRRRKRGRRIHRTGHAHVAVCKGFVLKNNDYLSSISKPRTKPLGNQ